MLTTRIGIFRRGALSWNMQDDKNLLVLTVPDRMASGGALTIEETAGWAGLGRGRIYEEVRAGRLKISKVGRRTLVRADDARSWLASLSSEAGFPSDGARS
jgi:excisionase family DNA binding protein